MWIIVGRQEASFRIRHLTEVIFDVLCEVPRRLDFIQWAEAAILGGILTSAISEGGGQVRC